MESLRKTGPLWAACVSLIPPGLLAFAPALQFDFVNWDDPAYVLNNPLIRSWSPENLCGIVTETITRNYAPLTIFSLLIDQTFWGLNPTGYHLTNLLLHLVNGVLVLLLVRQLTGSLFVAWTTAALFLVHPVQVETVAWVSSRKGLLSGAFMLAALLARLRPDAGARQDGWYIGMLAAALLSKALAIVLPPIVLIYDLLVRREKFADAIVRQVIPGLMSLLLLLHTMTAQNSILGGVRSHLELGLLQIVAADVLILWQYIGMLVYPCGLCVLYDPPTSGMAPAVVMGSVAWFAVGSILWMWRQRSPLWLFGAVCFLLLLLPVLNFFRITSLMNDRYLYLPCMVGFAMAAAALKNAIEFCASTAGRLRHLSERSVQAGVVAGAVTGCICLTNAQLPVWRDSDSLWTDAMQKIPQLPVVRIQMALTLHDSGRIQQAVQVMTRALRECAPDDLDRQRMNQAVRDWTAELATENEIIVTENDD